MSQKITPINLGMVHCYLISNENGFYLIDSAAGIQRRSLLKALQEAGCGPDELRLVLITHGDIDHTGNCAYLQQEYGVEVAMHPADTEMARKGDMGAGREIKGFRKLVFGIMPVLMGYRTFTPDIELQDEQDLGDWGLAARALHLPGHSPGSLSYLTPEGDLFCGDLLMGGKKPGLHFIVVDPAQAHASIARLKTLGVRTVYPGHGGLFAFEKFLENYTPPLVTE
jgi:glyoxylase-like metal-dependent hydrolase (beta-lactamase superfamily II)